MQKQTIIIPLPELTQSMKMMSTKNQRNCIFLMYTQTYMYWKGLDQA